MFKDYFDIYVGIVSGKDVVYKNKIIACGYNYSCNYMNDNYSIHAEVSAISQMFHNKKLLELCDIYVVRIAPASMNNCLKNSKPCRSCTNFINKYNKSASSLGSLLVV